MGDCKSPQKTIFQKTKEDAHGTSCKLVQSTDSFVLTKKFYGLVYRHKSERFASKIHFMGPFRLHVVLPDRPGKKP